MMRRWRIVLAVAALAVAGAASALGYWAAQTRSTSLPVLPVSTVPASWREFRLGRGHVIHVSEQGLACTKCHAAADTFSAPSMRVCGSCHAAEATIRHALHRDAVDELVGMAECTSCHGFGPGPHADNPWACVDCHELPQGHLEAVTVHADQACEKCHHPHDTPTLDPMACETCHAGAQNSHGPPVTHAADNCLVCHDAHAPASVANTRCADCHAKPHALFSDGHARCTDCHQPHGFAVREVNACRSCHRDQHVLGANNPRARHECTDCHDAHAVARVSDSTCRQCHTAIAASHPQVHGQTCIACHAPHPKLAMTAAANPCTSCHEKAPNDHAAHGAHAACTACHAPHAFAHPPQPQTCQSCHAPQLTATAVTAGHAQCSGCHRADIHGQDLTPVGCNTCHQAVHPRTEHLECTRCHEPHSGTPHAMRQSCGQCHTQQVSHGHEHHRDCSSCHTPHDGGKTVGAQCVSCHTAKATQNHAQVEGGCTQCHAIHGAERLLQAPSCTSCHAPSQLPGLHARTEHQQCKNCHQRGHDTGPFSSRAVCVTCHRAQRDHVPEAELCQGCHVFRD